MNDTAANDNVFSLPCVHSAFFLLVSADASEEGGKLSLSRSIFRLNSIPPCGMWVQLCLTLSVLLPTFMHVTAILHGQVVRFSQKLAEKKSMATSSYRLPWLT